MAPKAKDEVMAGLAKLSIKTTELDTPAAASHTKPKKKNSSPVADSWEDEADDDSASDTQEATPVASTHHAGGTSAPPPTPMSPVAKTSHAGTSAPPPTPMSPVASARRPFSPSALSGPGFTIPPFDGTNDYASPPSSSAGGPSKRPEKTDAVARRMIAGALGMRAPKLTEEQKAYDRAVREKEKKRREEEKERERKREEEAAKARQAIWDD